MTFYWKSKFKNVIHEMIYFNTDDVASDYFTSNNLRYKDLNIDILNCWGFYLEN